MSKPWFYKIALEQEPSPLAGIIADVLKPLNTSAESSESEADAPVTPQPTVLSIEASEKDIQPVKDFLNSTIHT